MPKNPQQLAKLSRPRLYDALPRERLFALLDEKRNHPAVWIAGPPGAGKTTLVCSYLEDRHLRGIWYHVDAGDNDPSTFFYYLTEAAKAFPSRRPLPLLTPEYLPDLPGFARRYFRELFSRLPDDAMVVLDNFHELAPASQLQQVISTALREIPMGTNFVIISRSEPPEAFSTHQAAETLVRIGWEELKLTIEEAEAIAAVRGAGDSGVVRTLLSRTDGWVAGLTLMLERLRRGIDGASMEAESHQTVFNYFTSQIFEEASIENQLTMLKTSLFATFSAELARDITGHRDAPRLLDYLCDRQLFTYRRGGAQPRYQYHDLFRDFLRKRATAHFRADDFRSLLIRAAELIEAQGGAEEAFALLIEAGEWDGAIRVVLASASDLLAQGRWKTLQEWIHAIPQPTVSRNPWLLYWLGNARIRSRPRQAREVLLPAIELFRQSDDTVGQAVAVSALVESVYFEWSDFSLLDPWIPVLEGLLRRQPRFPSIQSESRAVCGFFLAMLFRQPAHPEIGAYVERMKKLLEEVPDPNTKVTAALALLQYCLFCADLRFAAALIARISPLMDSQEIAPLNKVFWWSRCGYVYYLSVDYARGHAVLDRAQSIAEANGLGFTEMLTTFFRMLLRMTEEDIRNFEPLVRRIEALARPESRLDAVYLNYGLGVLAFKKKDMEEAARRQREAVEVSGALGVIWYEAVFKYSLAASLIELGRFDAALDCLSLAHGVLAGTAFRVYRLEADFLRAYMSFLQQGEDGIFPALRTVLTSAREEGYVYTFRGHRAQLAWLLAVALDRGIETDYVQSLVRKHGLLPPMSRVNAAWPWPLKVFTLGEFRVEVDGRPLAFGRKVPKKPLALLKAIIAFGGRNIPEQKLLDSLWPDEEGDAAREAFAVNLHRLRRLLVHADVVQLSEGLLSIDTRKCWTDVWALERQIAEEDRSMTAPEPDSVWRLYRGHFLAEDLESPWALSMRERVRSQFLRHIARAGRRSEEAGELDVAVLLYQKGIDTDDLAEELYQGLMRCHMQQDRRAEALAVFRRLRQTLSVTLGIQPSEQSERLVRSIQG